MTDQFRAKLVKIQNWKSTDCSSVKIRYLEKCTKSSSLQCKIICFFLQGFLLPLDVNKLFFNGTPCKFLLKGCREYR